MFNLTAKPVYSMFALFDSRVSAVLLQFSAPFTWRFSALMYHSTGDLCAPSTLGCQSACIFLLGPPLGAHQSPPAITNINTVCVSPVKSVVYLILQRPTGVVLVGAAVWWCNWEPSRAQGAECAFANAPPVGLFNRYDQDCVALYRRRTAL